MKEIVIENLILKLLSEKSNVRIIINDKDIIFVNQDIETISELIVNNFNVVKSHYESIINDKFEKPILEEDINNISIEIVLYYLYIYNSWRIMYKKQENKNLAFNQKDFANPSTNDIIFNYFKTRYPSDWEEKSAILLEMNLNELQIYYKNREDFYNK